ncbi:MAG: hypothetical protein QXK74_04785 [Candidatus Nitrosocaldaceae archaeon]
MIAKDDILDIYILRTIKSSNTVYDGNELLFIYDVGISVLRAQEFSFDSRYTYFNHFNNSLFGEEV